MKNIISKYLPCVFVMTMTTSAFAGSLGKADMLNQHGLISEAKLELIEVIFAEDGATKPEAYYMLGNIAFEENKISAALETWTKLVSEYPNSPESLLVKGKIKELSEVVGEAAKEAVGNAVASSYLRHGDFWSKGKDSRFNIDSSWIPNAESAIKWYDKVIKEFPNTVASKIAYRGKIRTLLGWKEPGKYGSSHGVVSSPEKYIPQLVDTFNAFVTEHPKAASIQAFRYQIAQVYWSEKDWSNTRLWLNKIIEASGDGDSFYKDLAQRRLNKVEY